MRADPVEPELRRDPRLARDVAGGRLARRVPVQHGVAVVEQVGADHERLGAAPLLRRAAVEPERALELPGLDLLGQGQAGGGRGRAEEVVAAGVAGRRPRPGVPGRLGLLREARQRVVFAQDADHRLARPDRGDERRRDPRDAPLDPEAARLQGVRQQRRRPLLLVADLGPFPDLPGHLPRAYRHATG